MVSGIICKAKRMKATMGYDGWMDGRGFINSRSNRISMDQLFEKVVGKTNQV